MTDGIINVNKPAGWTSQDVCTKLKHVLHVKKIGHTGTLDPMATGVLPVCTGKSTRIIEYYDKDSKVYHAAMKLGVTTDTLDITGEVTGTGDCSNVTEKAIREAFRAYTGQIDQTPPKYSALKINGKRAYDLAREGRDFEIQPRSITVYGNEVTFLDLKKGIVEFDVTCSKGTYIRTICDDIGRALGCGAAMTSLVRTASGFFRIEDSYTIDEIIAAADASQNIMIPADITLEKLGKILLNDNRITAFLNGNSTWPGGFKVTESSAFDDIYRVYAHDGGTLRFLGTASIQNRSLIPAKVMRT